MSLTFVDLLTVLVIVVSAIYAFYRGFISETLSILAWAAAAFASLYFGPWAVYLMREMIANGLVALIAGYALVFVAVLIPISFASYRFSQTVKDSPVGPLDRTLGVAFGVVRGLAVAGLAYLLFTFFVPTRDQPDMVRHARLLPIIQSSTEVLLALVPDRDRELARETDHEEHHDEIHEAGPRPQPKPTVAARVTHKRGLKAYGVRDRRALDRLIEATGNGSSGKP